MHSSERTNACGGSENPDPREDRDSAGGYGGTVGFNNAPHDLPDPLGHLPVKHLSPTVLDLFSGIGGFTLAFSQAGFRTLAFSEVEAYPSRVLAQRFPGIPNLGDVRHVYGKQFAGVDVVCGGFPCQDISAAGKGAGLYGPKSSLWFEALRIVRGARPRFCLFENVPALRTRGADIIIDGLEKAGYAVRPFVVGAVHAGAPHRRQRVWIVAYRNDAGQSAGEGQGQAGDDVGWGGASACDPDFQSLEVGVDGKRDEFAAAFGTDWWGAEPDVGRVAHGIPARVDRIKVLGNAIVPQVAYPFAEWMALQLTKDRPMAMGLLPAAAWLSEAATKIPGLRPPTPFNTESP